MDMDKRIRLIGMSLVVVMLVVTACAPAAPAPATSAQATAAPAKTSGGLVYYMAPELLDEFQSGTQKMMLEDGKKLGYDIRALNGANNATTQASQMDDVINQKPKAIILAAVDAQSIVSEVQKARAAGIAVLVYDRFIVDTPVDFTSVVGTVKIGQMAAAEVVKALKQKYGTEKGLVLELMGDSGDNYTVMIDQGFSQAIAKYPNIKVIIKPTAGYDVTTSASIVDDQLTANKNIDLIFVHADFRVPAITPVLQAHGLKKGDVIIIGTDGAPTGLQSIRDGWMQETIGVPMDQQVYGIWQYLEDAVAHKAFQAGTVDVQGVQSDIVNEKWGPTLYLPGQIVDKTNVDDANNWGNMKVDATKAP
jgi:ribose transport system substrate-binding protein